MNQNYNSFYCASLTSCELTILEYITELEGNALINRKPRTDDFKSEFSVLSTFCSPVVQ